MLTLSQLYIVALLFAASLLLLIVNIAWRRRPGPGVTSFIWLILACTAWTLGYALELSSSELPSKLFWFRIEAVGPACVATFGLIFMLNFSGHTTWLHWPRTVIFAAIPAATVLLVWTNDFHGLVYQNPRIVTRGSFLLLVFERGPWFWIALLYSYVLLLLTGGLIFDLAFALPNLYRKQVIAILVSFAVPWLSNFVHASSITSQPLPDLTPLSFAVTGMVLWWALLRYQFLIATPAARDAIIEHMRDIVLVVDTEHRILDLNEPAATFAGASKSTLIGTSVTHIFPTWPDLIAGMDAVTEGDEIAASVRSGTHYFDLHSVPVATRDSQNIGRLIVARDITDRQKHERELAILNDITRVALQTTDVQMTIHTLAARLQALFDTDTCFLFLYDEEEEALSPAIQLGEGSLESSADKMMLTSIANSVLDQEQALVQHIDKTHRTPAAVLGLPLLAGDTPLGAAVIRRETPADFTDSEISFGEQAVQQAALGIARLQALDTARQRASEAETLREASAAVLSTLQQDEAVDRILEQLAHVVSYDSAAVLLLRVGYLEIVGGRGFPDPQQVIGRRFHIPDDNPVYSVVTNRRPEVLHNVPDAFEIFEEFPHDPVQSWMGIPLIVRDELIGMLALDSRELNHFGENEVRMASAFADQVAIAIENARLYDRIRTRAKELDALYQATNALLTTLDLDTLLQRVLNAAIDAIPPAERGMLLLLDDNNQYLRIRAVKGYTNPHLYTIEFTADQGYATHALRTGESLLISDNYSEDHLAYDGEVEEMRQIRSAIVAPLILEEEAIGVISLDSTQTSAFTNGHLRLLQTFATTAAAAIQNATLHAEMQELATTDTLTNLLNRHGFFDLGRREVERSYRFGRKASAVMFDIDHFKRVNDEYGHAIGDEILAMLAQRCRGELRAVDLLGRYGGEEFIALLAETSLGRAYSVAERLRLVVSEEPFETSAGNIVITVSLGVAELGNTCSSLRELIDCADKALYEAKKAGRNRVSQHPLRPY